MGLHKQPSHTLPPTPIHHHHHSSDFEFTVSLSPPNSAATNLRSADELFYNGQLLPLHLSPRNSMVRTLFTTTTTTRRKSDYHSSLCSPSSRPSSATDDGDHLPNKLFHSNQKKVLIKKQFSFSKFSSVFHKETKPASATTTTTTTAEFATLSLKAKIRNYMKKLSKFHGLKTTPPMVKREDIISYSIPGNFRFLTRTSCVSSCPSTMPSSPYNSRVLCPKSDVSSHTNTLSSSTNTDDMQCAIQGAIAHCKKSMNTQ